MGIDLGSEVSHFRLEALLGAGGMGEVYLAEDVHLKRKVALKFLNGAAAANPDSLRRFLREAQAASALDHPNLAGIHEIGEWQGLPFLALAYCPGETLRHRIERGQLSIADIVSIQRQVAEGLASAHAVGIVHRDLKPANIMVGPDGLVRILDFGLAKVMAADSETASRLTRDGTTVGTIAYMAPEQIRGEAVDARADIWAFGVVLFEMLAGCLPFRGEHAFATWQAVLERAPAPVSSLRPDAPSTLVQIVERALEKDRAERTLTAAEAAGRIGALQASLSSQSMPINAGGAWLSRSRTVLTLSLGLVVVAAGLVGGWWYRHTAKVSWARDVALPEIARLAERQEFLPAFRLATEAELVLSNDPLLAQYSRQISRTISIGSSPAGADVLYRPFHQDQLPWNRLGQTPLDEARVPLGLLEWKIEKAGYHTIRDVGLLPPYLVISDRAPRVPHQYVLEPLGQQPAGMSLVSLRGPQLLAIAGLEHEAPFEIGDFWIDRLEVTNREFKSFVDAGGYREPRYWKRRFERGGRVLPWSEAMHEFADRTGRPGPAGWELGTYPEGKDNEPVEGVSWYEADAYAEYVHKMLPTIFHWSAVADRRATSGVLLSLGRYRSEGALPVGQSRAESRFGSYDLAGNVKEWCLNAAGAGRRYALGGGWADPSYYFNDADGRSPWDRSPSFGFRCMKLPPGQELEKRLSDAVDFHFRDFRLERPVNDEIFRAYASLFSYDHRDLRAVVGTVDDSPRDWRHETVSFNAAYGADRVIVHLLLPKRATPPFQTLVYYPGINALHQPSSADGLARMGDLADFVVRSGRAMALPVLKSTHERRDELRSDFPAVTTEFRDHVVMWSKDVQRTVDYLETRADIAPDKIGFLGRSWGGAMGTIMVATEPRFKLAIFHVGGFYFQRARPEVEAINFAPRVRVPSLMLNGRYDFFFPVETSQRHMFQLIGVPERHKRWVVYDTSHGLPRGETVKETLAWLDKYFGPVPLK